MDSDVIDKLIQKEENIKMSLTEAQQELLRPVFESQMPKDDKIHYNISFEAMSPDEAPVVITQNEFMRRMKQMVERWAAEAAWRRSWTRMPTTSPLR